MLSTTILFLRLWFSRNSILLSLTSFNDLQKCLRFIRNLSHGVRSLKLVTFIKTYLEYYQLQLQTLDITKFCMRQRKLRHPRLIHLMESNYGENIFKPFVYQIVMTKNIFTGCSLQALYSEIKRKDIKHNKLKTM